MVRVSQKTKDKRQSLKVKANKSSEVSKEGSKQLHTESCVFVYLSKQVRPSE